MNAPVKPFAWSFSVLDSYRTCPLKYYHNKVKKDFPEPQNEHMLWGLQVHEALAKRIERMVPLPDTMKQWEKWAQWAIEPRDNVTTVLCEKKLAVTERLQPCEYFDKKVHVWFRTVADVLKIKAPYARLIDWKTGKMKEGTEQLDLTALAVFQHYPDVDHVLCQYVWLQDDLKTEHLVSRHQFANLWARTLPEVVDLHKAHVSSNFPPRPSGLCKRHCNVISCAYHKRGAYG